MRKLTEASKGWLAGIIDGDGHWIFQRRKRTKADGYQYNFGLRVGNTNTEIPKKCLALTGIGRLMISQHKGKRNVMLWHVNATEVEELIKEILPYCVKEAPKIILEARKLIGLPKIHKGTWGGRWRPQKITDKLDLFFKYFTTLRSKKTVYYPHMNTEQIRALIADGSQVGSKAISLTAK